MSGVINNHAIEINLPDFLHGSNCDGTGIRTNFKLELCRKQAVLGPLPLDQWWIRKQGLYGERGKDSANRQKIVDCFWALCLAE